MYSIRKEYKNKGNEDGFSLLETIVAISILMMTIVGPLSLASKGIVFADYVKDEITGFYLAQEAVEAIRDVRDTNIKNNINWLDGISNQCTVLTGNASGVDSGCTLDIWDFNNPDHGIKKCTGDLAECEKMNVVDVAPSTNPNSPNTIRLYGYDFGGPSGTIVNNDHPKQPSIFTGKIHINTITNSCLKHPSIPPQDKSLLKLDPSGIDEINVTVEVSWIRGSTPRSVKVAENMFSI